MLGMQHRFVRFRNAKTGKLFVKIFVTAIQQINFWIREIRVGLFILSPIGASEITITATNKQLWLVNGFPCKSERTYRVGPRALENSQ